MGRCGDIFCQYKLLTLSIISAMPMIGLSSVYIVRENVLFDKPHFVGLITLTVGVCTILAGISYYFAMESEANWLAWVLGAVCMVCFGGALAVTTICATGLSNPTKRFNSRMRDLIEKYDSNGDGAKSKLDYMQKEWSCCGVESKGDWKQLPESCCADKNSNGTCDESHAYNETCNKNFTQVVSQYGYVMTLIGAFCALWILIMLLFIILMRIFHLIYDEEEEDDDK